MQLSAPWSKPDQWAPIPLCSCRLGSPPIIARTVVFLTIVGVQGNLFAGSVYWSDIALTPNQIQTFENGSVKTILDATSPLGLAIDWANQHIYWTDSTAQSSTIWRAHLANPRNTMQALVSDLMPGARGITLDLEGGKMYWANPGTGPGSQGQGKIQRANLNGSEPEPDFITGLQTPQVVALDQARRNIYWADSIDGIHRASLDDGSTQSPVPISGINWLHGGLAIDPVSLKIYWTDQNPDGSNGKLKRANLDGTTVEELVLGLQHPREIELDLAKGLVYLAESTKIRWFELDGSQQGEMTGLQSPYALALPEPSSVFAFCGIVCLCGRSRLRRRRTASS